MNKKIFGHIDCPSCGSKKSMRITHDKNGEPFGFCEAGCNQQLRIGGSQYRVEQFLKLYPWAKAEATNETESKQIESKSTENFFGL